MSLLDSRRDNGRGVNAATVTGHTDHCCSSESYAAVHLPSKISGPTADDSPVHCTSLKSVRIVFSVTAPVKESFFQSLFGMPCPEIILACLVTRKGDDRLWVACAENTHRRRRCFESPPFVRLELYDPCMTALHVWLSPPASSRRDESTVATSSSNCAKGKTVALPQSSRLFNYK